jgi:hypothetical protein
MFNNLRLHANKPGTKRGDSMTRLKVQADASKSMTDRLGSMLVLQAGKAEGEYKGYGEFRLGFPDPA